MSDALWKEIARGNRGVVERSQLQRLLANAEVIQQQNYDRQNEIFDRTEEILKGFEDTTERYSIAVQEVEMNSKDVLPLLKEYIEKLESEWDERISILNGLIDIVRNNQKAFQLGIVEASKARDEYIKKVESCEKERLFYLKQIELANKTIDRYNRRVG